MIKFILFPLRIISMRSNNYFFGLMILCFIFSGCSKSILPQAGNNPITLTTNLDVPHPDNFHGDSKMLDCFYGSQDQLIIQNFSLNYKDEKKIYNSKPIFLSIESEANWYKIFPGERLNITRDEAGELVFTNPSDSVRTGELLCTRLLLAAKSRGQVKFDKYRLTDSLVLLNNRTPQQQIQDDINIYVNNNYEALYKLSQQYSLTKIFIQEQVDYIQRDSLDHLYGLCNQFKKQLYPGNALVIKCKQWAQDLDSLTANKPFGTFESNAASLFKILMDDKNIRPRDSANFVKQFNLIQTSFTGIPKDYLLTQLTYSSVLKKINVPKKYLRKYKKVCANKDYKILVSNTIRQYKKLSKVKLNTSTDKLLTPGSKQTTLEKVLNKERGKLVLIDIWASWCVPCREQLRALMALKKRYGNNGGITIISLSIEKNLMGWQNTCLTENLMNDSYLFYDSRQSGFIRQYHVETIPRYILIGKTGELISSNAFLPGDPKLVELIDQHL